MTGNIKRRLMQTAITALLCQSYLAMAAEPERQRMRGSEILVAVLPIVFMILFLWFFLPWMMKKISGVDRYYQHLERIEVQLKRIADALEKNRTDSDHTG